MESYPILEKKKRGRKAKNIIIESSEPSDSLNINQEKVPKKRGRKPKGGKFVSNIPSNDNSNVSKINIILHLKCKLSDIKTSLQQPLNSSENFLNTYSFIESSKNSELNYMIINNKNNDNINTNNINTKSVKNNIYEDNYSNESSTSNDSIKNIWDKLEKLSNFLKFDNSYDKKCACFHCTCQFDNYPIYIPKYYLNNMYYVYGCFCSPECAAAFLMNDKSIDNCTRFERYYLLNYLYCKIYNYSKNIKPAPSPFYTLDKFMGNLSIQEYRKLLTCERMLLVIEKPLIKSYPELFEESDNYLINCQGIEAENKYSILKNKNNISNSKNEILNENFNK